MDDIPFTSHLNRLVTGTALHCTRRAAELKGSIAMLGEEDLSAEMTVATKHCLEAWSRINLQNSMLTVSRPVIRRLLRKSG